MEISVSITDNDVRKGGIVSLVSPRNPTPTKTVYLSNIDQTVAFPVQTVFFYEVPPGGGIPTFDVTERVRISVSEVLLIPYYFMAGRLNFNLQTKRLELVCNNAGVLFVGATSHLRLNELGNLSLPNPSFRHLVLQTEGFESFAETPIFTIQVTRFKCGGFSIGFVTNHSILDGRSAAEMFENLASICRGEGMKTHELNIDRSCIRARDPPQIKFKHTEYTKLAEATSLASSFTSPIQPPTSTTLTGLLPDHEFRMFSFNPDMIRCLKEKAMTKCSSFEAIVAHIWRARTKAIFDNLDEISSVLFAVDIRSRMSPPLPQGFSGNAVITASASAKVADLGEKPFSFCVEMVKEAIERVTDEYVRSGIDWLEVYKGMPSTLNGNFFLSAWWKLPFYELDFGVQSIKLSDCEITSTELKAIGTSCLSLKELSFSKCSGITDEDLSFIVSKHRDLLKLDITCCSEITDVSLANITSSCTSLTSLRMESCNLVSKEGFRLIGQRCHLLEELDLTDTDLDNEGLKAVSGCFKLSSLKIGLCMNINDEGLVHVGKCCPKLQVLDLYRCTGITDMGISAIGLGCPVLRMINLAYCSDITDDSLRSLSKCLNLDTLEIRGCPQVSSVGISAIAVGCRQLTKLDVKKCYDINDDGMLSLGRFSQNLRQINLSYCSVTDRGLLALASISCLQNMTILHLKGLTPNGLKNVLWACNGLRKMKLHSSLKSLIPQHILEYTQARGCMFQWSNKPYQAELLPNEIWKQQSRGMPV